MNSRESVAIVSLIAAHCLLACGDDDVTMPTPTTGVRDAQMPASALPPDAGQPPADSGTPSAAPVSPDASPAASPTPTLDGGPPATPPSPVAMPDTGVAGQTAEPPSSSTQIGGNTPADAFCEKYEEHCGFGKPMRHADRAACVADFDRTPRQQFCKTMHLDTAIAGTATLCDVVPREFCFNIHCVHATGLPDQTGVTYCN